MASGQLSRKYFDMRVLGTEGLYNAGLLLYDEIRKTNALSVGGLATGAVPLAAVISIISFQKGDNPPLQMFYVRKSPKEHGTGRLIEGVAEAPVAIVDDVITSGSSALQAARAISSENLEISGIFCVLFRGSKQNEKTLKKSGGIFGYTFTQDDF